MIHGKREIEDRFIESWGQIAGLWGVNRSIGRIHALLYLSPEPLHAETIKERLQISHGNCSNSLRELIAWGVIRRIHLPGKRKGHYESEQDPWTWFHTCIRERRRREVVPVVEALHDVCEYARRSPRKGDAATLERIERFTTFVDEFVELIDVFLAVGAGPMGKTLRAVAKLVPKGGRR